MSAQTAFRFPSVVDQWTNLFVAPVYVVGGQSVLQDVYNLQESNIYPLDGNNPVLSKPILTDVFDIPVFGPEKVTAFEIGYKGLYLNRKFLFDGYVFYNNYNLTIFPIIFFCILILLILSYNFILEFVKKYFLNGQNNVDDSYDFYKKEKNTGSLLYIGLISLFLFSDFTTFILSLLGSLFVISKVKTRITGF